VTFLKPARVNRAKAADQARRQTAEARAAVERARRQTAEARIAAEQALREAAQRQAEAERAAREAAQCCAAAERARRKAAENALQAMRSSASWQITRPLRAGGYIARWQCGRALLEMGLPLGQVERIAAWFGHKPAAGNGGLQPADSLAPADHPPLPFRAWRIHAYLKTVALPAESPHQANFDETANETRSRPRLAFISPLPPQATGIADYSAELLPELEKYYEVNLIVDRESFGQGLYEGRYPVHDAIWLKAHVQQFDRVIYHIGNSPFHTEMLELLEEIPGAVVLHDFFLGHLLANAEAARFAPSRWAQALYESHGYGAVCSEDMAGNRTEILFKYPVNHAVLKHAIGIIVHSESSRALARLWYGEHSADGWKVIPHLRKMAPIKAKAEARLCVGLDEADFVVCSFGDVGPAKLNHRLLDAWFRSRLAFDMRCVLIFVGQIFNGDYEEALHDVIARNGEFARVIFTGRAEVAAYKHYLAAADIGVQLRARSRGETSGTVLDCLSHALPTIVNANGAMAELPADAVWMLPNEFSDENLVEALEVLWQDQARRALIGASARKQVATGHDPGQCARLYAAAIESFHEREQDRITAIAWRLQGRPLTDEASRRHALQLAPLFAGGPPARRIFLDITETSRTDRKTGIERAARAITLALLKSPPPGYRVEPVYLTHEGGEWQYRCAIQYTLGLLNQSPHGWRDQPVIPHARDVLVTLDLSGEMLVAAVESGLFERLRAAGVASYAMVYDLLPIWMPQYFPPGAAVYHAKWLEAVTRLDGAVCISKTVANALTAWLDHAGAADRKFKIAWSLLGADVANSAPSSGIPEDAMQLLEALAARRTFLMVGTIEPRKGYGQAIEAFSRLWRDGHDINLIIIGKQGWQDLPETMRRSIPEIVERLLDHDELERRLFWLEGISDEYLEKIYAAATCLILASENEGFGLPIIEAARHGLPIIARDIEVFREIAGENAFYFSGLAPALGDAVLAWLKHHESSSYPCSDRIPRLTWAQSARRLMEIILEEALSPVVQ
jgi:glycosyltransferase involved in cell wall biosynthesis